MGGLGFSIPPCPQAAIIQNAYMIYDIHFLGKMGPFDWLRNLYIRSVFRRQLPKTKLVICQTVTMKEILRNNYNY